MGTGEEFCIGERTKYIPGFKIDIITVFTQV